jgi:uncharacterized protein
MDCIKKITGNIKLKMPKEERTWTNLRKNCPSDTKSIFYSILNDLIDP